MKTMNYIFMVIYAIIGIMSVIGMFLGKYHMVVGLIIAGVLLIALHIDNKTIEL